MSNTPFDQNSPRPPELGVLQWHRQQTDMATLWLTRHRGRVGKKVTSHQNPIWESWETSEDALVLKPQELYTLVSGGDKTEYSFTVISVQQTVNSVQCTVQYIQYIVYSEHFTFYIVQCTIYSKHCTVYIVQCIVNSVQFKICTLSSIHCPVYSLLVHCTVYDVNCTPYSAECIVSSVHSTVYSIQYQVFRL